MPDLNDKNMKSPNNMQDRFLLAAMKGKKPVNIHIINGYEIKNALIIEFDNYAIICETEGCRKMIYKHAVSTIAVAERAAPVKAGTVKKGREEGHIKPAGNDNAGKTDEER